MDLSFSKEGEYYVADATVRRDFRLFLQRPSRGSIIIEQRDLDDPTFVHWRTIPATVAPSSVGLDFHLPVYPKQIRVSSRVEVTHGDITETVNSSASDVESDAIHADLINRLSNLENGTGSVVDQRQTEEIESLKSDLEDATSLASEDDIDGMF